MYMHTLRTYYGSKYANDRFRTKRTGGGCFQDILEKARNRMTRPSSVAIFVVKFQNKVSEASAPIVSRNDQDAAYTHQKLTSKQIRRAKNIECKRHD
ncbi:hypothetical protein T10_13293 [Trichinella papuae]|uniref:Uncharacterized protein n=1 Tax=Trichinella papuae TaxID=268474 RepID=A0A0V1MKZ2_9BILA|nr:hypothetical protein T10_13293 [Trichinella papuae]